MSYGSDDLTPRPAPSPSENKAAMIIPSVPDVSIVFDPSSSNSIRPQSFTPTPNYTRPIFNRPTAKFEPINEQDQHPPVRSPPPAPVVFAPRVDQNQVIKSTHPVISGHQLDYHQQYLNHQHQMTQQSELKQYYTPQPCYTPPSQHNTCNCHHIQLSATPHITSQLHSENISDTRPIKPQSPVPQENAELKNILEILKHNQSELRLINENNERNRKLSENLLLELQDYKKTITTILNIQDTIESRISEVEEKMQQNFDEIKTILNTKFNNIMNNNNCETENRQILPKYINNGKLIFQNRAGDDNQPNKFILSDCKNPTIFKQHKPKLIQIERNSPVSDAAVQPPNGEMKELFNKYEIKGALNRRSIEYSVSSLNYLQRYGLLEEHN